MDEKWNVIVVDDHPIVRTGLHDILIRFPFINNIKLADGGKSFLALMKKQTADLVILDIQMPDMDGVDLAKMIKENHKETRVLMFSSHLSIQYISQCYEIGVDGYISKDADTSEIKTAIQEVMKGEKFYSADVKNILFQKLVQKDTNRRNNNLGAFSDRELEIMKFVCGGKSNKKIAELLFISENTVNNHRAKIMKKANCHNVTELYEFALTNNLVTKNF